MNQTWKDETSQTIKPGVTLLSEVGIFIRKEFPWISNNQTNHHHLHPPKQTWNLKMDPWKRRFLLETIISRFHVNFWGCTQPIKTSKLSPKNMCFLCLPCFTSHTRKKEATKTPDLPGEGKKTLWIQSPNLRMVAWNLYTLLR